MTLTHYKVSSDCKRAAQASGFDIDDPDIRYQVHNSTMEKVVAEKPRPRDPHDPRENLLLKGRGLMGRMLGRAALSLMTVSTIGLLASPEAFAGEPTSHIRQLIDFWEATALGLKSVPWDTVLLGGILASGIWANTSHYKQTHKHKEKKTMRIPKANSKKLTAWRARALVDAHEPTHNWHIDGASRMGKVRAENQDAFFTWGVSATEMAIGVFDGAGGVEGGKEAANTASEVILAELKQSQSLKMLPIERLEQAIEKARQVFHEKQLSGITTAIVAIVKDGMLYYATLGDGALAAIWPDGMVAQVQTVHHILGQPSNIIGAFIGQDCSIAARTGSVRVEAGTTLLLMSDGASDLFPYEDFAENRDIYTVPLASKNECGLADHFLAQLEAARDQKTNAYLHHDNMTLVLAHYALAVVEGESANISERQEVTRD